MNAPVYPVPPPPPEEVRAWLTDAAVARRARVERLVGVLAPATADAPVPSGWRSWWTPIASAPSAEDRLREGWRRAVVLRDRRDRVGIERGAIRAELDAVVDKIAAVHAGKRVAVEAIEGLAAHVADPAARAEARGWVRAWFADACAFVDAGDQLRVVRDAAIELDDLCERLWSALDTLARQEQAEAVEAAADVTRGSAEHRHDAMESAAKALDDVVVRLRTAARGARAGLERMPLIRREGREWDLAEAEISDTLDAQVIERWLARRRMRDGA